LITYRHCYLQVQNLEKIIFIINKWPDDYTWIVHLMWIWKTMWT
jgi:hypothetical protein